MAKVSGVGQKGDGDRSAAAAESGAAAASEAGDRMAPGEAADAAKEASEAEAALGGDSVLRKQMESVVQQCTCPITLVSARVFCRCHMLPICLVRHIGGWWIGI